MSRVVRAFTLALRGIRRSPGFSALVLVTLALGIAAVTSIFSLVNALAFQAMPYPDGDRLVLLNETLENRGNAPVMVSYPNVSSWRQMNETFDEVAATRLLSVPMRTDEAPVLVSANFVSPGYFDILGARTRAGRLFGAEGSAATDDDSAVVVRAGFVGSSAGEVVDVGDTVVLMDRPFTVVGVLDEEFRDLYDPNPTDVWLSVQAISSQFPDYDENRRRRSFASIGKLSPGIDATVALDELAAIATALTEQYPQANDGFGVAIVPLTEAVAGTLDDLLWALLGGALVLLLIAVVNVASLVVVRGAAAQVEIAVCRALGAPMADAIGKVVAECLLLALGGAAAGLVMAAVVVRVVMAAGVITLPTYLDVRPDWRVGAFAVLLAVVAGVLASVLPALRLSRVDLRRALVSGDGRGSLSVGSSGLRRALVVTQVAAAVVVVAGATLLVRSLAELQESSPGFRTRDVVLAAVDLPRERYDVEAVGRAANAFQEELRKIPGVEAVGLWGPATPLLGGPAESIVPEGALGEEREAFSPRYHLVGPDSLDHAGIAVVRGRGIGPADRFGALPVVVVSRALAEALWPGQDAIGKRLASTGAAAQGNAVWYTVVGVAEDALLAGRNPGPMPVPMTHDLYYSVQQHDHRRRGELVVWINLAGTVDELTARVRSAAVAAGVEAPVQELTSLQELLDQEETLPGFSAAMMGIFGALSLGLAALGIYGILSQSIAQSRREIGLRKALGSPTGRIVRQVGGEGMRLAVLGIVAGLGLSVWAVRVLEAFLFGIENLDPFALGATSVLILVVAAAAAIVPTLRAVRLDASHVLRGQ